MITKIGHQYGFVLDCSNRERSLLLLIDIYMLLLMAILLAELGHWDGRISSFVVRTKAVAKFRDIFSHQSYPAESHHLIFNVAVIVSKSKIR